MKSERQAERTAAFCASVGALGVSAVVGFGRADGFFAGSTRSAGSAGAVVAAFGADGPLTAALHADDKSAAFACRQSTSSGLVGAIQEQCAAMSSSVQTRRTATSRSFCDSVAGVCLAPVAGGVVAAGVIASTAAGVSAGAVAGFAATASMAVLQDAERLS